ncbi:Tho complex subunit 7-domain-containing protein [Cyathus striatus]|nr:Tho complex subunit 7-domain-containing protein [Cyathus striatus]
MAVSNAQYEVPEVRNLHFTSPTVEEDDQIIHARITNDERPLRRIIKKFHVYTSLTQQPISSSSSTSEAPSLLEDAREAFLVELASFQLSLKKSAMICEAEARQVKEYEKERQRIEQERETLRSQIEELKVALEHAQMLRRRKIEYDLIAEKVNTLPTRDELEQSIQVLENDMSSIQLEHETQNRILYGQKSSLDRIISELIALKFMGKDKDAPLSATASPRATPTPDGGIGISADSGNVGESVVNTDKEDGEEDQKEGSVAATAPSEGAIEDDIEMGEVEEDPREKGKKKLREELEEGEASDASSELSEPPED